MSTGVPPVNSALEPAWVRNGSAETQRAYQVALAFEQMLVQEMTSSLSQEGAFGGGEGEAGGEGEGQDSKLGGGMLSSLLPQALSQGIASAGGLGLAPQLTRELEGNLGVGHAGPGAAGATAPAATGGASAGTVATTGTSGGTSA
jgi:Rod binding domain-containing protein